MNLEVLLTLAASLLLLLLSSFESAYDMLSEVSLRVLASEHERKRHGTFLARLVETPERLTLSLGFGRQLCVVSIAILLTHMIWTTNTRGRIALAFVASLAVIVVFREVLPRLIAQNKPESILVGLLPFASAFIRATDPLLAPVSRAFERFRVREEDAPLAGEDDDQSGEIQALIDVGEQEGILEASEGEMIQSIVELSDRGVSEVMTPRTRIVSIPSSATIREARDTMIDSKFSRLPIYRDSLDNVIGIVYVRDLLKNWQTGDLDISVTSVMRPAYFVPETNTVRDQLEAMRKSKTHVAMVIDEYGAVAGLITIEDLLEEIVGEIEDEDRTADAEGLEEICEAGGGEYVVSGAAEIRKVELLFGAELAADDFTTVAGLVIKELGHMPKAGETLSINDLEFRVTAANDRRIEKVCIRRSASAGTVSDAGNSSTEAGQHSQS